MSTFRLEPPPGFRGLNPYETIEIYTRHLPHWRQKGATHFVTFRLADSLPEEKLEELKRIKREWEGEIQGTLSEQARKEAWERLARITFEKAERWLDEGMGSCVLRNPNAREIVSESLEFFDGDRSELGCHVIMPNHVHVVIRPLGDHRLESVLRSVKRNAARKINALNGTTGPLWQEESYDRIVRDAEHLWRCVQYVGKNPRKANLPAGGFMRWIRPDWDEAGWRFGE